MTVKDKLIRKIAENKNMDSNIIDRIISHQFDSAKDATVNNNSIEFSGFGKLVFNENRAKKQLEKYEMQRDYYTNALLDNTLSSSERKTIELKLNSTVSNINHIKPKIRICPN